MTRKQIEFKAEPDGEVRQLKDLEVVQAGDFLQWMTDADAFTNIETGSALVGVAAHGIKVFRIVPKQGGGR